jgi:hypothetical protein
MPKTDVYLWVIETRGGKALAAQIEKREFETTSNYRGFLRMKRARRNITIWYTYHHSLSPKELKDALWRWDKLQGSLAL